MSRTAETVGACGGSGDAATALGAAEWLGLLAAPTFASMALVTMLFGGGQPDVLCAATQTASHLGGMVPMYLLMSAFHLAPWLRLIFGRPSPAHRPQVSAFWTGMVVLCHAIAVRRRSAQTGEASEDRGT